MKVKKITLKEIGGKLELVVKHVLTTENAVQIRPEMAAKEQLSTMLGQVNSIERQLLETRTEIRLRDFEEKVFGQARRW